ncbi:MAG: Do family serine endopeptidase [Deltaproteobacteria bacterium]|nr:Do family serine endopeptidase [Deltaproteobacteria bacterium]
MRATFRLFALVAVLCAGLVWSSAPGAQPSGRFWNEPGSEGEPALPKGYSPLPSLSGLVQQLRPAVVNIYTTQVIRARPMSDPFAGLLGRSDPFERFFRGQTREFKQRSLGTGFIISPDGFIVTNHHVVARADEIRVRLVDERAFDAKLIGSDPGADVALLKVEADGKLPAAVLGDSSRLEVGDWVVAIGNPFGLSHTVSAGIISATDRQIGRSRYSDYDDFLQTDASINPGNSGGPLFDTAGRVIGINTAIVGQGTGIGFAVPINLAKELLPQLRATGRVKRGWLGIGIQDLTEELAERFGAEPGKGVLVSQIFDDSPAERGGLRAGDVIVSIDGKPVADSRSLGRQVAAVIPGSRVRVELIRNGKTRHLRLEVGERDAPHGRGRGLEPEPGPVPGEGGELLGLQLAPLTPERARRLGLGEEVRGLAVLEVSPDGPTAGILERGDVILEVNRQRVTSEAELARALKRGLKQSSVLLLVQRGASQVYVVIQGKK